MNLDDRFTCIILFILSCGLTAFWIWRYKNYIKEEEDVTQDYAPDPNAKLYPLKIGVCFLLNLYFFLKMTGLWNLLFMRS